MCVDNGLDMSFYEFTEETGSVIAISFAKDVSLGESSLAVGTLGSFEMLLDVNFKNINPFDDINFDLNVLVVNNGVMTLSKGSCVINTGILSRQDVLEAQELEPSIYEEQIDLYRGGSFYSSFKEGLKKTQPYVKKGVELAKKYGPTALKAAKTAAELVPLLMSAGMSREEAEMQAGLLLGGKKVGKAQSKRMKSRF